jgi:hypothetical protein
MWRLEGKHTNNIHQVCIIISKAAEDDDGGNNPMINSQDVNQGNYSKKERDKVYVSAGVWRMIKLVVNHGTTILADPRREVLMGVTSQNFNKFKICMHAFIPSSCT